MNSGLRQFPASWPADYVYVRGSIYDYFFSNLVGNYFWGYE